MLEQPLPLIPNWKINCRYCVFSEKHLWAVLWLTGSNKFASPGLCEWEKDLESKKQANNRLSVSSQAASSGMYFPQSTHRVFSYTKKEWYAPERTGGAMAAASTSLTTYEQVENVHATSGLSVCTHTHSFVGQHTHRHTYRTFIWMSVKTYVGICMCIEIAHTTYVSGCLAVQLSRCAVTGSFSLPSVRGWVLFPSSVHDSERPAFLLPIKWSYA